MVPKAAVGCAAVWCSVDVVVEVGKALLEILRALKSSADCLEEQRVSSAGEVRLLLIMAEGELHCPRLFQPQHPALCIADHPRAHPLLQGSLVSSTNDMRRDHHKAVELT